jgi:hypothetical protein
MKLEDANKIATLVRAVLSRNIGNTVSEDLALGMYNNVVAGMQQLVDTAPISAGPDKPTRDTD